MFYVMASIHLYSQSFWKKEQNAFNKRGRRERVMFWYKPKPCCDILGQGYRTQYITEII
jgi:hypothetical protein